MDQTIFLNPMKTIAEINRKIKDRDAVVLTAKELCGAVGYVIGEGTRSTRGRRNLSLFEDMHEMDGSCISGFATSSGPDLINSIAVPIPVLDEDVLSRASRLDSEIELPVVGIRTRKDIGRTDYSQFWRSGSELRVTFEQSLRPLQRMQCEVPDRCVHRQRGDR